LSRKLKELEKKLDVSNQRNEELQAEVTKLEWENYELKEQNEDLKKRKVLTCPVCLDPKEEWKITGCGYVLCIECIETLKEEDMFWDHPCPVCRAPIQSLGKFHPDIQS
jgi:rubrerythrin